MRHPKRPLKTLLAATVMLLLVACGGGSDDPVVTPPPAASNEVPASAQVNAQAYVSYFNGLASSETAEPLVVDKVVPPTSETEEPQPL